MPPLLLDDDEAVAVAIGLRTATQGAVAGIEETSLRALAKLEQVLPPRLRRQVSTLQGVTVQVRRGRPGPDGGPGDAHRDRPPRSRPLHAPVRLLGPATGGIAAACRAVPDRQRRAALVPRRVGPRPRGLADVPRRPDAARACRRARGSRPRELTDADAEALVARGVPVEARQHQARVVVQAPAAELVERWGPMLGTVTPIDETSCTIHAGADTVEQLAAWLGMLGVDFQVTEPPELLAAVTRCPLASRRPRPEEGAPEHLECSTDAVPRLQPDDLGLKRSVEHSGCSTGVRNRARGTPSTRNRCI